VSGGGLRVTAMYRIGLSRQRSLKRLDQWQKFQAAWNL